MSPRRQLLVQIEILLGLRTRRRIDRHDVLQIQRDRRARSRTELADRTLNSSLERALRGHVAAPRRGAAQPPLIVDRRVVGQAELFERPMQTDI